MGLNSCYHPAPDTTTLANVAQVDIERLDCHVPGERLTACNTTLVALAVVLIARCGLR